MVAERPRNGRDNSHEPAITIAIVYRRSGGIGIGRLDFADVAFNELKENNWWKENNTSLILAPEPVIEDIELRKLRKKSLELAGII